MGVEDFTKYDLALRQWERVGYVSDREGSPFVYYHLGLNEYRLDRYLITEAELTQKTEGDWWLVDIDLIRARGDATGLVTTKDYIELADGEIIGCKTEGVPQNHGDWFGMGTPGYWIVSSLGQIEIVPGSVIKKPIRVQVDD